MWQKRIEILLMATIPLAISLGVHSAAPDSVASILFPPCVALFFALFFCLVLSFFRPPHRTFSGVTMITIGALFTCVNPLVNTTMIPGGSSNFLDRDPLLSAIGAGSGLVALAIIIFGMVHMFTSKTVEKNTDHSDEK